MDMHILAKFVAFISLVALCGEVIGATAKQRPSLKDSTDAPCQVTGECSQTVDDWWLF